MENSPYGNVKPEGGGGERLPAETAVNPEMLPAFAEAHAFAFPVAVAMQRLVIILYTYAFPALLELETSAVGSLTTALPPLTATDQPYA